jgi:hypothetical protein
MRHNQTGVLYFHYGNQPVTSVRVLWSVHEALQRAAFEISPLRCTIIGMRERFEGSPTTPVRHSCLSRSQLRDQSCESASSRISLGEAQTTKKLGAFIDEDQVVAECDTSDQALKRIFARRS